jgi:hypothetical protein
MRSIGIYFCGCFSYSSRSLPAEMSYLRAQRTRLGCSQTMKLWILMQCTNPTNTLSPFFCSVFVVGTAIFCLCQSQKVKVQHANHLWLETLLLRPQQLTRCHHVLYQHHYHGGVVGILHARPAPLGQRRRFLHRQPNAWAHVLWASGGVRPGGGWAFLAHLRPGWSSS